MEKSHESHSTLFSVLCEFAETWRWPIAGGNLAACPWPDLDCHRFERQRDGHQIQSGLCDWFKARGYHFCASDSHFFVVPIISIIPPKLIFHTTPSGNWDRIRRCGFLLTAREAGESTTGREDAADDVHVSLDIASAQNWTRRDLLAKEKVGIQWVIVEIQREGIQGRVFRDPASETGYLLECKSVAAEFLREVRRFTR